MARAYLVRLTKNAREASDASILNARADHLNREARDVLHYQGLFALVSRLAILRSQ